MLTENRAFCDTSMTFSTPCICPMKTCFKTGPQPDLCLRGCGSHFFSLKWPTLEFSISHISANTIDKKLILLCVTML